MADSGDEDAERKQRKAESRRRYNEKRKADPIEREKARLRAQQYRERIRADPAKREEFLRSKRDYYQAVQADPPRRQHAFDMRREALRRRALTEEGQRARDASRAAYRHRMTQMREEFPDLYAAFRAKEAIRNREYYQRNKQQKRDSAKRYRSTPAGAEVLRGKYRRRYLRQKARASPAEILDLAVRAIPKGLPREVRDDVIGSIALACLEGTLAIHDIAKRMAEFLRAHNREYDARKVLSLDAKIPGTDITYLERLAMDDADDE